MTCPQCIGIETQFNDKVARRDLKKFRRSGPKASTKVLLDELRKVGIKGRSLLDIGGGIGAVQHACAIEGASRIVNVDASPAYLSVARSEAERMGYLVRASYAQGNFVDLAPTIESADFVTLDRVLCCYHDMQALLKPAADRAKGHLGLVFPREEWWVRLGARLGNSLLRLCGSEFRAFVHPHSEIQDCATASGLSLAYSTFSGIWRIAVFRRTTSTQTDR